MESIKNAIVTMTLLAVGYGSYVVLKNPVQPGSFTDFSEQRVSAPDYQSDIAKHPTSASSDAQSAASMIGIQPPVATPPNSNQAAANAAASRFGQDLPSMPVQEQQELAKVLDLPPTQPGPAPPQGAPKLEMPALSPPASDDGRWGTEPTNLAPPEISNDFAPTASDIQPPVAAISDPQNRFGNPSTGPFATPIQPTAEPPTLENVATQALNVPKIDTAKVDSPSQNIALPEVDRSLTTSPPSQPSEGSAVFEKSWVTVQELVRDRELTRALSTLTTWYHDQTLNKEQRSRMLQLLDQLAGTVIYSREHLLESEYSVAEGETLADLSARFQVPASLLAKINGIAPPFALVTGERLKVLKGPFRAEVSLFKSELTLFIGSNYAGRFPVTIGPDLPPEEAVYEVAEKANGRSYFDRKTGLEILRNNSQNRYGDHWMGMRGDHITTGHGVGIHGRPLRYTSDNAGSISMDPLDAEDVFSILSIGSRVHVKD